MGATSQSTSNPARPIAGRYEVLELLGSGGMGRVDLVRDARDGYLLALKRVPLSEPRHADTLRRELMLRVGLAHPQVPAALGLGEDPVDGCAWLALEYAAGESLLVGAELWGAAHARALLAHALNVVGFLHRRGVVHGDLKPENFVVSSPGEGRSPHVSLLDFGLAHAMADEASTAPRGGTRAYMAPTQLAGHAGSPSTDLYALGKTFQEALRAVEPGPDVADAWAKARDVIRRLVHPDADLRYMSADDALRDLIPDDAERRALPTALEAPYVGQDAARQSVSGALEGLRTGLLERAVVLVDGAGGSGRSRLLRGLREEAWLAGTRVIEVGLPRRAGPLELPLALARQLLPEPSEELRSLTSSLGSEGAPMGLLRDLWRALQRVAEDESVLVLIDNLQRADAATLAFVALAARLPSRRGPLLVATWRRTEGVVDERLRRLVAEGTAQAVSLPPLEQQALEVLVTALLPAAAAPGLAAEIAVTSQGNPGLATLLAREGAAPASDEGASHLDRLLDLRVGRLQADARALLAALAVLQRPAPLVVLRAVAGLGESDLKTHLATLEQAGLATATGHGAARRIAITGRRLRTYSLRTVGVDTARAMHAAAWNAWSAWPRAEERPSAMLVEHALGAADVERALEPGMHVARQLTLAGGAQDALALLDQLLLMAQEHDTRRVVALQELLAVAYVRTGHASEAEALLNGPLGQLANEDDALAARLYLLRGTMDESRGKLVAAHEALAAAVALPAKLLGASDRLRAWERLGAVHFRQGRHDEARAAWCRGLAEAPEGDDSLERANLLNDLGAIDTWQGHFEEAEVRHREALLVRRSRRDLDGESRSLTNLANLALKRAEFTTARRYYVEGLRIMREVGTPHAQAKSLSNLAIVCNLLGDYGDALSHLDESLALRARSGDPVGVAVTRRQRAALFLHKGELASAREELARAREGLMEADAGEAYALPFAMQEAELFLQAGDFEAAAARATGALKALPESTQSTERFDLMLLRGRARLLQDDLPRAREDIGAAHAGFRSQGDTLNRGWARFHEGQLAERARDHDAARRAFLDAHQTASDLGARRLACEGTLALASLEAESDPDRAGAYLEAAAHGAEALGVPDLVLAVRAQKGAQALRLGQHRRALAWWRRCAEDLNDAVGRLGPDGDVPMYLAHPKRRWILEALDELLRVEEGRLGREAEVRG